MPRKITRTKSRSCGRKVGHETWASAKAHRQSMIDNGAYGPRLRIYKCKRCEKLHVGHIEGVS